MFYVIEKILPVMKFFRACLPDNNREEKQGYRSIIGMQADFCPKKGFNIKKSLKSKKVGL